MGLGPHGCCVWSHSASRLICLIVADAHSAGESLSAMRRAARACAGQFNREAELVAFISHWLVASVALGSKSPATGPMPPMRICIRDGHSRQPDRGRFAMGLCGDPGIRRHCGAERVVTRSDLFESRLTRNCGIQLWSAMKN